MNTSRKERNEQAVADRAARLMADTRAQWLRTRASRITLAVTMIVVILLLPVVWTLLGAIAGLALVLVAAAVWWLLRLSVREIADLPEEYLDERQSTLRGRTYVEAYQWFGGSIMLLASIGLVVFIVNSGDFDTWTVELRYEPVMGMFWMLEAAALSIPSLVLALRDRELPR